MPYFNCTIVVQKRLFFQTGSTSAGELCYLSRIIRYQFGAEDAMDYNFALVAASLIVFAYLVLRLTMHGINVQ